MSVNHSDTYLVFNILRVCQSNAVGSNDCSVRLAKVHARLPRYSRIFKKKEEKLQHGNDFKTDAGLNNVVLV